MLDNILQKARNENVRIFQPGDPSYDRVKAISNRLIASSHYRDSPNVRYEVLDYEDANAFASGGGNYFVLQGLLDVTNDAELAFIIGHGIIKDGAFKMTVSEVLNDNESVLTVIFEAGPQVAMVKTSKCERVQ
jgi:predicted Zn-dependent protease